MRFLLINPYYPISETPSPPLGLAYLAGALEREGIEVRLLDLVVFPYSKNLLQTVLNDFSPDFAGTTAVTMTYNNAIAVIKDIKHLNPDIITVIGGPHVTFYAEEALKATPELDFVVMGEGEETIIELVKESKAGKKWGNVRGIAFRKGTQIFTTGMREFIPDLSALPYPSRHLIPLGRYRSLGMPISITTSRGCPFNCIFCIGRKMSGRKVRYRDPADVVDEIERICSLNFHQINIADDLFTANNTHCISICEEMIRRKINVRWAAFSRVDTITLKALQKMKDAGCCAISFGVESGNEGILKSIKKGITLDQVLSAARMCNDSGINAHASFILGLPGETAATLKDTVEFGEKLKDMGVSHGFHLLAPFPGTEIRENAESYDIKILTENWPEYHANRAIVETSSVNKDELDEIVIGWENKFVQYLGDIKTRMARGEAGEDEINLVSNLESTVLIYDLMMAGVIEEKGCWDNKGKHLTAKDHLKTLVEIIGGHPNFNKDQIYDILNNSADRKNLICEEKNGRICWRWSDFI